VANTTATRPTPAIALRAMQRADLEQILAIERTSFPSPWPRSAFELAIAAPDLLSVVAYTHAVLGYIIACPDVNDLLIANVAVHRRARRHGLGRRLLDLAIGRARELHLTSCKLDVRMSNEAAQRLYDRIGFEPHSILPGYYQNPAEDALHMRLALDR